MRPGTGEQPWGVRQGGVHLSIEPAQCRFATQVRVRWADTDAAGIAYNGAYLTWLEVARVEYFRALAAHARGVPLDDPLVQDRLLEVYPLTFALASCAIEWKAPVRVDARVRLWMRTSRLGRRSLEQEYVLERAADGQRVALAHTATVHINEATLAPAELPQEMRAAIEAFEAALACGQLVHRG
jgi:acyl-CoA thioester hydrolase